jgi:hypothetical protein
VSHPELSRNALIGKVDNEAAHSIPYQPSRNSWTETMQDDLSTKAWRHHSRGANLYICVQEGGFAGPEIGPKQRRIKNRLLSYRPNVKNNLEVLSGRVLTAQRIPASLMPELLHKTHVRRWSAFGGFLN